ncbi:MAG: hypothetical protein EBU88_01660 [Acidobacteria bacterium]|nr:hypothetical protein [Acidobacteriota bacterium]
MSYLTLQTVLVALSLISTNNLLTGAQVVDDRISVHELKLKMDRKEKILILDARSGNALIGSRVRIKGARHFTSRDLDRSADSLPRDRDIIIYCT